MLKWTRERFNLVDFINILFNERPSISGEAYTALMNHMRSDDPDLASELSKSVVFIGGAADARVQLAAVLTLDAGEEDPEKWALPPAEAAKLTPEARNILSDMQDLFFMNDGVVDPNQEVSGFDCVEITSQLLRALGLWPVPADEYQPGQ